VPATTELGALTVRWWVVTAVVALVVLVGAGAGLIAWAARGGTGELVATSMLGASEEPAGPYAVWDHNEDGTPVRWDPCTPIEVVVAPERAYDGLVADVEVALATLTDATGLDLRLAGTTSERPAGDRPAHTTGPDGVVWAPILVAAASPHEDGVPLRDTDRGVAVPLAVGTPGDRVYVTGQVVLNADRDDLVPGFDDRATSWGSTVLHELAHVLGLAHVDDPAQLLWTYPGEGPVELAAGDLAGLDAVGAAHGCIEVPHARPVEVTRP
jgi:hypothetical protein